MQSRDAGLALPGEDWAERSSAFRLLFSEEDGGYIADIPDLPHCAAFGETPEQALAEALKAKAAWIEAAKAEGKPVPPPTFRPVIYQVSKVPA
jgi:predicted RNase H-like HicB family nuclease